VQGGVALSDTADTAIAVSDNRQELRYELRVDGRLAASIAYRLEPGVVVLVHTDVEPSFEGRGLGSRLVKAALDDIRARGLSMTPLCPFVALYLRRHPEHADLVVPDPAVSD
jgi:predicted GNAT family acetyltransferase